MSAGDREGYIETKDRFLIITGTPVRVTKGKSQNPKATAPSLTSEIWEFAFVTSRWVAM